MSRNRFLAVRAQQSAAHQVLTFAATAAEVLAFAEIDRIGRDPQGQLKGFQRPQIAGHIREIRDYVEKPDAVLPNAVVIAFTEGVRVEELDDGVCRVTIDTSGSPKGVVVDGQQRLTALGQADRPDFQLFVALLLCRDEIELRRQFVLINNTRPLPKSLIYELLPTVDGLPDRMESRSAAAALTEKLNHNAKSSLNGHIIQHTNPGGVIKDTVIQKALMMSLSDGILRELMLKPHGQRECLTLVSEFFEAVKKTFPDAWHNHDANSSRLLGGAGIQAMMAVMELLAHNGARKWSQFAEGMECLKGRTAWTDGTWDFGGGDVRHWKAIQVVSRDVIFLTNYLESIVRRDLRIKRAGAQEPAALEDLMLAKTDS
jgi:DGQHR domain-containing protein